MVLSLSLDRDTAVAMVIRVIEKICSGRDGGSLSAGPSTMECVVGSGSSKIFRCMQKIGPAVILFIYLFRFFFLQILTSTVGPQVAGDCRIGLWQG